MVAKALVWAVVVLSHGYERNVSSFSFSINRNWQELYTDYAVNVHIL